MKKILLLIGYTFTALFTFGQTGELFPEINVLDLNNKAITIPEDIKGKYSLIGVAFSEDAQKDLYTRSQPVVFSEFLDYNNLLSLVYDPNVHLILMFTEANQLAYNNAKQKIT